AAAAPPQEGSLPEVVSFSPQGVSRDVQQVRATFSTPVVPFGDPHSSASPFQVSCSPEQVGEGRWIDAREWVYEFPSPLPAGVQCRFTVMADFKTLDGRTIREGSFRFSTGAPAVRQILPSDGFGNIDEEQIFILILDGPVDESSVVQHAFFTVDGLASPVRVELIDGDARSIILENQFSANNMPDHVVLIQARQRFPALTRVDLVWDSGIRATSGITSQQTQTFQFRTRPAFTATVSCRRENPDRDCIPLTPIMVRFSAPISRTDAESIRLEGPPGTFVAPRLTDGDWVQYVEFEGPFSPLSRFTLHLPSGLRDDAGRLLVNADRFPFEIRTDQYPPLAKFAADFGIIEAENPVLPVTVRNLESTLDLDWWRADTAPFISGSFQRIEPDETLQMMNWVRMIRQRSWEDRNRSIFEAPSMFKPQDFVLPRPGTEKDFEVIGIPLPGPGFYVVELKSEILGASLLGTSEPMYVPTAVLVTGLGVHLKWGFEQSLVWVTSLAEGRPVEGAAVQIRDCEGRLLAEGATDSRGLLNVDLPSRDEVTRCGYGPFDQGLLVSARLGDDLGLVHSEWTEGIEPWRFQLMTSWQAEEISAHTILDRALVRAGETVHMKHVVRRPTSNGFDQMPAELKPNKLVIRHMGSDQSFEFPLELDEQGIGLSSWEIPEDARLGSYSIELSRDGSGQPENWTSGSFRVEEFRVPIMRATLRPPAEELVQPSQVSIDFSVEFLGGGVASNLPVRLRYRLGDVWSSAVPGYDDFRFSEGEVTEGIIRSGEREEDSPEEFHLVELQLDEMGSGRVTIEDLPRVERPRRLTAELEYRDPNGEMQTVATDIPVWPAGRRIGIKVDDWVLTEDSIEATAVVVDLDGNPVAGAPVSIEFFQRNTFSHRKRLVGGFYAYEHFTDTRALGEVCQGSTDEHGIFECSSPPPVSGNVIVQAVTRDQEGRRVVTHRGLWVAGEDNWFAVGDDDRIDLIPEQESYEPGDIARFQVRMPFGRATALVTVEREGVIETYLREVVAEKPVIEVPIRGYYAPNVYVSALLVRGRIHEAPPTAMADPGKPAYKLGIAEISIGWKRHQLDVAVETD
ncbi:MAG TPA: MG2 domain-containing protein, partial [Acidobacteriota bacterium]|nr:MG2 domain-containing protein [Acidobacteriota bacterium]